MEEIYRRSVAVQLLQVLLLFSFFYWISSLECLLCDGTKTAKTRSACLDPTKVSRTCATVGAFPDSSYQCFTLQYILPDGVGTAVRRGCGIPEDLPTGSTATYLSTWSFSDPEHPAVRLNKDIVPDLSCVDCGKYETYCTGGPLNTTCDDTQDESDVICDRYMAQYACNNGTRTNLVYSCGCGRVPSSIRSPANPSTPCPVAWSEKRHYDIAYCAETTYILECSAHRGPHLDGSATLLALVIALAEPIMYS